MKNVIVIIGYNRPASIRRCYEAVNKAMYPSEDQVDLIFSLDHSDLQDSIVSMINTLEWTHGQKKVIAHDERQGLRKHVISCGTLVKDYDCLVMLEDDIVVSNSFYLYARQAALTYDRYPQVVGISLYRHALYPQNGRLFTPEYNGSDVFFMQAAQSWGQAWTKRMWDGFYAWYQANQTFQQTLAMPDYAYSWDQRSWLRYFMGYVCSDDFCLVYPYHSLSTNTEEAGENRKTRDTDYSVDLINSQKEFRMPAPEKCVHYDSHYERKKDAFFSCFYDNQPVLIDLNGSYSRYGDYRYVVSTNILDYHVVESYGLELRPQEINLREKTAGNDIFLYDLSKPENNQERKKVNPALVRYDVRAVSWKRLIYLGFHEWRNGGK